MAMLISHRKRFIYTKTVKTAGTSVESYFEPHCMRDGEWSFSHGRREYVSEAGIVGIRSGEPLEIQGSLWWNHMPARAIRSLIGEATWNDYFKFCVVRNPFDALVSAYRFFWASKQPPRPRGLLERFTSRAGRAAALADLRAGFEHWLRTVQLPLDRNKYCIDGALCVDYVIRYEALVDGIHEVCRRLGIAFEPERLPHLKRSEKSVVPLENYFTPASVALVENGYVLELQTFGYGRPWEQTAPVPAAA